MIDAFVRVISQADAKGEFLSKADLHTIKKIVSQGKKRLDLVNCITLNAPAIYSNAARILFSDQPQLIQPGGNAYTNRRAAACVRDMEIILRYITYAMFAGDTSILDNRCLDGLHETYETLGVPGGSVADGVQFMKDISFKIVNHYDTSQSDEHSELMTELAAYFDRASAAIA